MLFSAVGSIAAQSDIPGSQDYPLLSRFQGSVIRKYKVDDYGEFKVALGPGYQATGSTVALRKAQSFEGKHTMIQYGAPAGKSDLEIIRSYERALTTLGFTRLYACATDECGANFTQQLYTTQESLNPLLASYGFTYHYTVWKGSKDSAGYTVAICAVSPPPSAGAGTYQIEVVENTSMAQGTVTVDAAQMSKSIQAEGHMALYGILFDTNSAELRHESATTVEQIAKLLSSNPSLHIAVVGHTDWQGAWTANMDLSRRRAAAVVAQLSGKYGISSARLTAAGVGAAAPIADNRSEAGRSKNRRVELVALP